MEASVIRREGWGHKSVLRAGSRLWNFPGARTKGARYQCRHLKKHKGWGSGDKAPGWGGPLSRMCLLGRWLLFTRRISQARRKLGWAAEKLLQDSKQGFCGERNILSSLVDASGQKGTIRVRHPGRKSSVWFGLKLFSLQEMKCWKGGRKELCLLPAVISECPVLGGRMGSIAPGLWAPWVKSPFLWRSSSLLPSKEGQRRTV